MEGLMCLQFISFYLLVPFEVTAAWVSCECTLWSACACTRVQNVWKSVWSERTRLWFPFFFFVVVARTKRCLLLFVTSACLAWHVLFSVGGFSRFEEWQFKGCQFLMARYCAACKTSWVPSRQLQQRVFQHGNTTDVGRGAGVTESCLTVTDVVLLTLSKGQDNWNIHQRIVWISWVPPHFISPKIDPGCQWDTLSGTTCRNVNTASLDLSFHLSSSLKEPHICL